MERLLVQTSASDKDPEFEKEKIDGVPFNEFFRSQGVKIHKRVKNREGKDIELTQSCHGNPGYSRMTAEQMQALQDQGHLILAMERGGLNFARPSSEAAIARSVPFLSVPLPSGSPLYDMAAFLGPTVPGGKEDMPWSAAIGGVSIGNYRTASYVAREILTKEFKGVYIWGMQQALVETLLGKLEIPVLGRVKVSNPEKVDGILIGEVHPTDFEKFEQSTPLGIYSAAVEPSYLMRASAGLQHSVYAGRPENTAVLAARIMAAYRPETKLALKVGATRKACTYVEPKITIDSFE